MRSVGGNLSRHRDEPVQSAAGGQPGELLFQRGDSREVGTNIVVAALLMGE